MPGFNGIGWFEIGTGDPAAAERFYGDVLGWTVSHDDTQSTDPAYQILTTGDAAGLRGGRFEAKANAPIDAVGAVLVGEVEAPCGRAEEAGGTVQRAPEVNPAGVTFAHLLDPAGNHFSVFKPPFVQA